MNSPRKYALTMSLYVNSRGFAFVLFEGTLSPYDWGMFEIRGTKKHQLVMDKVTSLLRRYVPDVLVMQDTGPEGTRRVNRLAELNSALGSLARELGIPIFTYSRADVYGAFRSMGFANKQMLAALIAKHIPAFERHVPPPRKPWMSEDARMGLFDAAALALLFFQRAGMEQSTK
jgi:Holliday junction resolvasome RuvABC endonuclease subunit